MAIAIERKLKVVPILQNRGFFKTPFYKELLELDFLKKVAVSFSMFSRFFLLMSSIHKGTRMKRRTKNAQRHRQLSCHGICISINTQN
jgi:hypothetical protein